MAVDSCSLLFDEEKLKPVGCRTFQGYVSLHQAPAA